MKRIGLLGGMSWESSIEYYRLVNEATRDRLGGLHSADCLLRSVDFTEIAAWRLALRHAVAASSAKVSSSARSSWLTLCGRA